MSKRPTKPGFYWALWIVTEPGTVEGDEITPAVMWEIVHVIENHIDPNHPEYLRVMLPGIDEWQSPDNFEWGDFVAEERYR